MELYISKELRRFNRLLGELNGLYHEAAVRLGLSDSGMSVLYILCEEGGACPLSELVRQSGTSKQTINSALRKLEGEGMVRLEAAGGRGKTVRLTGEGQALAGRTAARLIRLEDEIFAAWGPEASAEYNQMTQRYLEDFREKSRRFQQEKRPGESGRRGRK